MPLDMTQKYWLYDSNAYKLNVVPAKPRLVSIPSVIQDNFLGNSMGNIYTVVEESGRKTIGVREELLFKEEFNVWQLYRHHLILLRDKLNKQRIDNEVKTVLIRKELEGSVD